MAERTFDARERPESISLMLRHLGEQFFSGESRKVLLTESPDGAEVTIDGASAKVRTDELWEPDETKKRKLAAAKAFALAANALGEYPAYGTLTGVRPVKAAYRYRNLFGIDAPQKFMDDFCVSEEKTSLLFSLADKEIGIEKTLGKKDVLLYVSIPFCPTKCAYCSFVSSAIPKRTDLLSEYLNLLFRDLDALGEIIKEKALNVRAFYVGGGTPGILGEKELFSLAEKLFGISSKDAESTFELGRPDVITKEKLDALKNCGVKRISVNPQSTNDAVLSAIGRSHCAKDFFEAYSLAAKRGFEINCDLIAGLPGDDIESFEKSVDDVLSLEPANVTVHSFCLKNGAQKGFSLPERRIAEDMMRYSHSRCISSGRDSYYLYRQKNSSGALENIGYALPGTECFYNVAMMEDLLPALAAGAGAISKIPSGGKNLRLAEYKYPFEYLSRRDKTAYNLDVIRRELQKDRIKRKE
ncbi:MAG: coproporphyrinogen dehydrogenase HemZ [Clostridia bacterium]|nr:coproporphyrinogen dehydrogenase HemZ [Clostridia bacterium]